MDAFLNFIMKFYNFTKIKDISSQCNQNGLQPSMLKSL